MALASALAAPVHAQELSDEQRAEIQARIAPVGDVCLQGENCGGLPKKSSAPMAAAPKPAASKPAAAEEASDTEEETTTEIAASDESADSASDGADAATDGESEEVAADADSESGAAASVAAASSSIDGEAIYNQACMACHMSGVGGAPVVGNIDSWAPRIAKGIEALHSSGINGVAGTAMMAKGGRMDLSDEQVMAAVDYMVSTSQ
jgi:cytochrome c5